MSQLSEKHARQLWPEPSERIFFLNHSKNESDCIERCLKSVQGLTDKAIVLVDSSTTDNTMELASKHASVHKFDWQHSYSYAKNECLRVAREKHGLKRGDWVLFMGADFELQPHTIPEIKEFVKDPQNFFAQFWVPEYAPTPGMKVVTRQRKLLWRDHPWIYWERSVHEEAVNSAYRLTGQGIPFGDIEWKEFPTLGGANGMIHYGFHEDGGEEGDVFWRKKCYYALLYQIDLARVKGRFPETPQGMLDALSWISNSPQTDLVKAVDEMLAFYMAGGIPKGLGDFYSPDWLMNNYLEHP